MTTAGTLALDHGKHVAAGTVVSSCGTAIDTAVQTQPVSSVQFHTVQYSTVQFSSGISKPHSWHTSEAAIDAAHHVQVIASDGHSPPAAAAAAPARSWDPQSHFEL